MMRLSSIRARMTAGFSLAIAALMMLACAGILWLARHSAERRADALLDSARRQIRYEIGGDEEHHDAREVFRETAEQLRSDGLTLALIDRHGRPVLRSSGAVPVTSQTAGHAWRTATVPAGEGSFVIGLPWEQTERDLARLSLALLALTLLVSTAAAI